MKDDIAKKYIELSKTTPLNKITAKALSEACGISRQTFYYYYDDIVEVLKYIIQKFCFKLAEECMQENNLNKSLHIFYEKIRTHFVFLRKIIESPYRLMVEAEAISTVEKMLMNLSKGWEDTSFSSHDEIDFVFNILSCGIVGYIEEQAYKDSISSDDWAEYVERFMKHRGVIRKTK